jgi:hypothetical protein
LQQIQLIRQITNSLLSILSLEFLFLSLANIASH